MASFLIHVFADGFVYSFGVMVPELLQELEGNHTTAGWVLSTLLGLTLGIGEVLRKRLYFNFSHQRSDRLSDHKSNGLSFHNHSRRVHCCMWLWCELFRNECQLSHGVCWTCNGCVIILFPFANELAQVLASVSCTARQSSLSQCTSSDVEVSPQALRYAALVLAHFSTRP